MVLFSKNYSFTERQEYAIIDQPEQRSNTKEEDKHKNSLQVCIQPGQMYAINIQNMFRRDFHLLYLLIPVGVMANDCTEF